MTKTIEDLFFYTVFVADFFVIGLILLFLRPIAINKVLWLITFYCLFNSLSNFAPTFISTKDIYLSLVVFTSVEYLVFAIIFLIIIKNLVIKKTIIGLSILFLIIVFLNYYYNPKNKIDSLPIGIETIFILIFCFYYLYEQMNDLSDSFIYNRYHFWIAIGILLYLGGSFFIYIFADKIDAHILDDYWFLTYAFYIIKNIFFSIGIAHVINQKKNNTLPKIKTYSTQ
jgi:hypothetical protein